jgi:hypothetical protein
VNLSAKQIAILAMGAGWSPRLAVTATAIALAESSGNPNAVNSASGAAGLWQIYPGSQALLDPEANARAAYNRYQSQGWGAWSAYNSKAYLTYMPAAWAAVRSVTAQVGQVATTPGTYGNTATAPVSFVGDIARDLATFFSFLTSGSTWIRVGEALGGAVLLLFALYLLFSQTQVGKDVRSVATKGAA